VAVDGDSAEVRGSVAFGTSRLSPGVLSDEAGSQEQERREFGGYPESRARRRARRGGGPAGVEFPRVGSLDDVVRPRQQRGRDRHSEGFSGLEVDDQLVFIRPLDR